MFHRELRKEEVGLGTDVGGEGAPATKVHADSLEPLAEATNDIKNEGAVADGLTQVYKHVGHAFHLLVVLGYGQITLREDMKLGYKEQSVRLAVAEELGFHNNPSIVGSGVPCGDGGGEIVSDGDDDP